METRKLDERGVLALMLEQYIDKHGATELLHVVAEIAYDKSEHILSNWQDEDLAWLWREWGSKVQELGEQAPS
uniref:Uncharacterized protein n=1 Tax=viral metagenome TaxID=1070528 RepID=A0A6H1ZR93_9ZZZZ